MWSGRSDSFMGYDFMAAFRGNFSGAAKPPMPSAPTARPGYQEQQTRGVAAGSQFASPRTPQRRPSPQSAAQSSPRALPRRQSPQSALRASPRGPGIALSAPYFGVFDARVPCVQLIPLLQTETQDPRPQSARQLYPASRFTASLGDHPERSPLGGQVSSRLISPSETGYVAGHESGNALVSADVVSAGFEGSRTITKMDGATSSRNYRSRVRPASDHGRNDPDHSPICAQTVSNSTMGDEERQTKHKVMLALVSMNGF